VAPSSSASSNTKMPTRNALPVLIWTSIADSRRLRYLKKC